MKRKIITIIVVVVLIIFLGIAGLYLTGYFAPKPGGLRIETSPKASVFINGSRVGETPYEGSFEVGKILLKLVPKDVNEYLLSYETSINLESGIETVVGRNFKKNESESSGYVVSFEKNKGKTAGLSVISLPDNAQVVVDGVSRGFSPYNIPAIAPAVHTITIKSPGYLDFAMTVKTILGYRLTFFVKLGKDLGEKGAEKSQKADKIVTILNTPTGYLRVRSLPGENGEEIAQVKTGEGYLYIDTDVATGFIEIQYQAPKAGMPTGITGWISDKYASVSASEVK